MAQARLTACSGVCATGLQWPAGALWAECPDGPQPAPMAYYFFLSFFLSGKTDCMQWKTYVDLRSGELKATSLRGRVYKQDANGTVSFEATNCNLTGERCAATSLSHLSHPSTPQLCTGGSGSVLDHPWLAAVVLAACWAPSNSGQAWTGLPASPARLHGAGQPKLTLSPHRHRHPSQATRSRAALRLATGATAPSPSPPSCAPPMCARRGAA